MYNISNKLHYFLKNRFQLPATPNQGGILVVTFIYKEKVRMSYVKKTLSKDEIIKKNVKLHWINYLAPLICLIFLSLLTVIAIGEAIETGFFGPMIFWFVPWPVVFYNFISLFFVEMVITNKRVVYKSGIIATYTEELKNAKIESVEIRQGILDRLLDTGDIHFSGTGTSQIRFKGVDEPWKIKRSIEEYIGD